MFERAEKICRWDAVAVAREIGGRGPEALRISVVILAANEQEWARGRSVMNSRLMRHKSFDELSRLGFGEIVVAAGVAVRNLDGSVLAVERSWKPASRH